MRLESVDIDHIYAGVCVLVQFACMTRRTQNKPHADVVEWDDEVILSVVPRHLFIACTHDSKAL